ncbi:hypothetical protein MWU65_10135 [Cellulophaga sp. F20128]|uniref:hypothetical protein n=1 Tax=Cellulophaga sp. F20128 TaxID=2926413 RepID=UPI001FF18886|nr:hypothetical protein [Cellulophaga sp. F20128]MCK0157538.1 hypothetical protein [Cellulophaga sp. F20128]
MDELDILKKDWQKKGEELPKLSYNDIYKMIWKKSSSSVKWIFIISILEFLLPNLLFLIPSVRTHQLEIYYGNNSNYLLMWFTIFQYFVIFYFIFQFYKRYKEISVLDDAKTLMKNILRTRKTVKHYVIFSLSMIFLTTLLMAASVYFNPDMLSVFYKAEIPDGYTEAELRTILAIGFVIVGIIITSLIGLIYFLLYGLLIRKLNRNYRELKRMEI